MPAAYIYRSGAAPTAVDSLTEVTREIGTAAAQRLQGSAFRQIVRATIAPGWTIDTTGDEYVGLCVLDGNGLAQQRIEMLYGGFSGHGAGATITSFPIYGEALGYEDSFASKGSADVATDFVQHGDAVATGFNAVELAYI